MSKALAAQAQGRGLVQRLEWESDRPQQAVLELSGGPALLLQDLGERNIARLAQLCRHDDVWLDWSHRYFGRRSYVLRFRSASGTLWTFAACVTLLGPTP